MAALPKTTVLDLEPEEGWLTIWFNQPEKRNALTDALSEELQQTLRAVREDRSVRGITLRGRGGVFCAGGDLKQFKSEFQSEASLDAVKEMSRGAARLFDAVYDAPQVTIAVVEGAAVAGGFGMMCCADVVIAAEDVKFAMTEAMLGISPAQISPFVVKRVGVARGRRLMLTGERITATEAQSMGLVDFLASDAAALEDIELRFKKQILKGAPGVAGATKALVRDGERLSREDFIDRAADVFARQLQSDEAREGVASFFEKRAPSWAVSGKGGQ